MPIGVINTKRSNVGGKLNINVKKLNYSRLFVYFLFIFFKVINFFNYFLPFIKRFFSIPIHIPHYTPAIFKCTEQSKIPKVIYQTFEKDAIPFGLYLNTLTWRLLNLNYDYYYFDNHACRNFILKNFSHKYLVAYDKLKFGAAKADLFRYLIIYQKGGLYSDIDAICLKPLKLFSRNSDAHLLFYKKYKADKLQSIFGFEKQSPILKSLIDEVLYNIEHCNVNDITEITGPKIFNKVINKYNLIPVIQYGKVKGHGFFEPKFFYPTQHWKFRQKKESVFEG